MLIIRLVFLVVLLTLLLCINIFQLLSLLIRPFSQISFDRFNAKCAAFWWYLLVNSLEGVCGVKVEVSGDEPVHEAHSAFIISNHQSLLDPLVILIIARKLKALSYLKWFVKDSLRYVPLIGWGLLFLNCVFLKRNWLQDKNNIYASFRKLKISQDPIWLVSFVEGTRSTAGKIKQSREFSKSQSVEPFQKVLHPKHKGFLVIIECFGNRMDVIYDLTIAYSHPRPTISALLKGEISTVKVRVQKTPFSALPKLEIEQKSWLINQFRLKDKILLESGL